MPELSGTRTRHSAGAPPIPVAFVFALLAACSLCTPSALAGVVYVNQAGAPLAIDGTSWSTAFIRIQDGLNAAKSGDEVWVARGTYGELLTLPGGVAVYGGFTGAETARSQRDWAANPTTLDGGTTHDNVHCNSNGAILDGFTLSRSPTGINVGTGTLTVRNDSFDLMGTGVVVTDISQVILENSVFLHGTLVALQALNGSTLVTRNCVFQPGSIGAALSQNSAATLVGCLFAGRSTAVSVNASTVTVRDCTILGSTFALNSSTGGVATLVNDTVVANSRGIYGKGLALTVSNCIVAFNGEWGIWVQGTTAPVISHNDLFGNGVANVNGFGDPTGQNGNISVDPKLSSIFRSVHIQPDSPCRDAGDSNLVSAGETDIDGQARIQGPAVDIGSDESDGTVQAPPPAPLWYVSPAGNDLNDGRSWATAKRTIGAAQSASQPGDEVWVAKGTYGETFQINPGVAVYGGFAGTESARDQRDWQANTTSVVGTGNTPVVSSIQIGTLLDGFTIQNGWPDVSVAEFSTLTLSHCTVTGSAGDGVDVRLGRAILVNNTITGNATAGVYVEQYGSAALTGNTITNNYDGADVNGSFTSDGDSFDANHNYGLDLTTGQATLTNISVTGSTASGLHVIGSVNVLGGFIAGNNPGVTVTGTATFTGASIVTNKSDGISMTGGQLTTYRCLISNNTYSGVSVTNGGTATVRSCQLHGNASTGFSMNGGSMAVLQNDTVHGNGIGVLVSGAGTTAHLSNNIIAANTSFGVRNFNTAAALTLSHDDVFGNTPDYYQVAAGTAGADISVDPMFRTIFPRRFDLHLSAGSPCIDAGDDSAVQQGDHDLDGNPRVLGSHVDMGAYEFVPAGYVTLTDVTNGLRIAGGLSTAAPGDLARLNVIDPGTPSIDLIDAIRLARKVSGLDPNP